MYLREVCELECLVLEAHIWHSMDDVVLLAGTTYIVPVLRYFGSRLRRRWALIGRRLLFDQEYLLPLLFTSFLYVYWSISFTKWLHANVLHLQLVIRMLSF